MNTVHFFFYRLFGDTMNTASRIESTGSPNRIHVSQATAGLLARAGKADWAVERKDKVTAKGKGELTTYWVNVISSPFPFAVTLSFLSTDQSAFPALASRPAVA